MDKAWADWSASRSDPRAWPGGDAASSDADTDTDTLTFQCEPKAKGAVGGGCQCVRPGGGRGDRARVGGGASKCKCKCKCRCGCGCRCRYRQVGGGGGSRDGHTRGQEHWRRRLALAFLRPAAAGTRGQQQQCAGAAAPRECSGLSIHHEWRGPRRPSQLGRINLHWLGSLLSDDCRARDVRVI